jgi:hypothetical protein
VLSRPVPIWVPKVTDPAPLLHPILRDVPPRQAKLWRYLTFAKFAAFLESSQLHFTRVDQFDDHFEGAWPKQDIERWGEVRGVNVPGVTERMRGKTAASCWVESEHESAAMWQLYAPGSEGVAVITSFGKLVDLVHNAKLDDLAGSHPGDRGFAGAARVRYVDHFGGGLIEEVKEGAPWPNTLWPFMLKNVSYRHENEVRALLVAGFGGEMPPEGVDIPINLQDFVEEIRVTPYAERWFVKAIKGLVERYGLLGGLRPSSLSPDAFYIKRA